MSHSVPRIDISPPLLNSACPWATTLEDLQALFRCSFTGAITIRTSLLEGFHHDPDIHQHTFFDPVTHVTHGAAGSPSSSALVSETASLNTLGYSPIPLRTYLSYISDISTEQSPPTRKLIIVSVTGTPEEVAECYRLIAEHSLTVDMPLAMEVNLSCPNIPNAPPPAYSGEAIYRYLAALKTVIGSAPDLSRLPFGLKTPPYTYIEQFTTLISALTPGDSPGMAGAPLHPLALGNVSTLRRMLDQDELTKHVVIIGTGGVEDGAGYRRMRGAGARAVGLATALGRKGLSVFEEIGTDADLFR
ncbi:dihydroorotate dehydrogenase-like protein [Apiospora kogelbergensis]|uniref:dihydroorotate dehydrogenase-like protein n=1 Tax=Apiospora kogelbergensis TaxID=1337665 RepID=UPI00312F6D49